uniref:Exonuclease 1 n=1 Tax=Mesocestoides corti TaxID=53468 RepID=A0A5K3F1L5_MESCO
MCYSDSIDASLSCAIALANVDFYTGEQVDTFDPEHFKVRHLFTAPKLPQGAFEESSNVNRIQACSPIKSILKKVHRPDGERLNKSIWNKDYKLEPVWLHYTSGAGSQPRPFCISLEDSKTDQLENGFCQNHETGMVKPVDPLPAAAPSKAQLRLVAGEVVHRNHRVFAPSVLTGEPAVLRRDLTRNGKCEESSAEEDVRIKDVLASYESGSGQYSLTSPLRMFEASETPVTSAGDYFASPVSTTIPGGCCAGTEDHQKSPIFHPKRQRRTLYAEPSLPISTTVDLTHPETDPAFLQRSSSCNSGTKRKTSSKTVRAFSLMQFSFTKRKKEPATGMPPSLTPEQRHHVRGESVLSARKENIQPRSPVYGNQTPVPAENVFGAKTKCQTGSNSNNARARPHISPLFLKWQFSSSKENSL